MKSLNVKGLYFFFCQASCSLATLSQSDIPLNSLDYGFLICGTCSPSGCLKCVCLWGGVNCVCEVFSELWKCFALMQFFWLDREIVKKIFESCLNLAPATNGPIEVNNTYFYWSKYLLFLAFSLVFPHVLLISSNSIHAFFFPSDWNFFFLKLFFKTLLYMLIEISGKEYM